jgi:hypothetical protein
MEVSMFVIEMKEPWNDLKGYLGVQEGQCTPSLTWAKLFLREEHAQSRMAALLGETKDNYVLTVRAVSEEEIDRDRVADGRGTLAAADQARKDQTNTVVFTSLWKDGAPTEPGVYWLLLENMVTPAFVTVGVFKMRRMVLRYSLPDLRSLDVRWCRSDQNGDYTIVRHMKLKAPEVPGGEKSDLDSELIEAIRAESLRSDRMGDELVARVMKWVKGDPDPEEKYRQAQQRLAAMPNAWAMVERGLRGLGHY